MKKIVILFVLFLFVGRLCSQNVYNLKVIAQDASVSEFLSYLSSQNSAGKLKRIARACMDVNVYSRANMAYQCLLKKNAKHFKVEDVEDFYSCLIKLGRSDEVPMKEFEKYNLDLSEIIDFAFIYNSFARQDGKLTSSFMKVKKFDSLLDNGFFLKGDRIGICNSINRRIFFIDSLGNSLDSDNNKLLRLNKNKSLIDYQENEDVGLVYTVYLEKIGVTQIMIKSEILGDFKWNSRNYSNSMPVWDAKSNRLYYCSNSKKGMGGWDIWYSNWKNNRWEEPVCMGSEVNTKLNETFPEIINNRLYFSSDGRPGKGGMDNYAYDFNGNTFNLINYNTTKNDYCLKSFNRKYFLACMDSQIQIMSKGKFDEMSINEKQLESYIKARDIFSIESLFRKSKSVVEKNKHSQFVLKCNDKCQDDVLPQPIIKEKIVKENGNFIAEPYAEKNTTFLNVNYKKGSFYLTGTNRSKVSKEVKSMVLKNKDELLVFGSCDENKDTGKNYYMSLQRINDLLAICENELEDAYKFTRIVLGNTYLHRGDSVYENYRSVFLNTSGINSPYRTLLAIPKAAGFSLEELAQKYGNDLEKIKAVNERLSREDMKHLYFVGITRIHKVVKFDTIYRCAVWGECKVEDIYRANDKNSSLIYPGEILIIPIAFKEK
jgi:LysM repeat protein